MVASTLNSSLSSTDCLGTVRSTSPLVLYLLICVDRVPLMFLGGDFLGNVGGLGKIGRAGGETLATKSFNLLDCIFCRGILGMTYLSASPLDVDGWTSTVSDRFDF